jgi:tight adherence protein C
VLALSFVAFSLAAGAALSGGWLLLPREVDDRLVSAVPAWKSPRSGFAEVVERLVGGLSRRLEVQLGPRRVARIRDQLVAGGSHGHEAVRDHLNRRALHLIVVSFLALGIGLLSGAVYLLPSFILAAWFWSERQLAMAVRKRGQRIESELPDFLDVAAVMLSAGLSFREVLNRVTDGMPGPVSEEIGYMLRQLDLGIPLREAMSDLRARNRSEAFDKFVASLLQADELGAPLSETLIALAGDIRRDAAQNARRRAARAAPRVSFVLTILMVPASMLLLLTGLWFGAEIDLGDLFSV